MDNKKKYKCIRCGGPVILGQNGLLRGLSLSPDGDPSMVIKDTIDAIHYADDCGNPHQEIKSPKLGPLDKE